MSTPRTIKHIFHPTDLSRASEVAFLHALRMTVASRALLTILHVGESEEAWNALPQVRMTLKKWGLLKDDRDAAEFMTLGIGVRKLLTGGKGPVEACENYLNDHPTDLVVLATHQESGRMGWLRKKVAEPLMRSVGEATLLVPHDRPGFVDAATGAVTLKRILLPIAPDPDPMQAVRAATFLAHHLVDTPIEFTLLHVGAAAEMPSLNLPDRKGWTWNSIAREGDIVDTILSVEKEERTDLIVMSTHGHDGFLDAIRGSTTERVLRGSSCPLLTGVI